MVLYVNCCKIKRKSCEHPHSHHLFSSTCNSKIHRFVSSIATGIKFWIISFYFTIIRARWDLVSTIFHSNCHSTWRTAADPIQDPLFHHFLAIFSFEKKLAMFLFLCRQCVRFKCYSIRKDRITMESNHRTDNTKTRLWLVSCETIAAHSRGCCTAIRKLSDGLS